MLAEHQRASGSGLKFMNTPPHKVPTVPIKGLMRDGDEAGG